MSASVRSHVDPVERVAVISTRFDHPIERVWTLFTDSAKLARWWGPPGLPMTIDHHDLRPGGRVDLTVVTPDGPIHGCWTISVVTPPHHLSFVFESDGIEATDISVDLSSEIGAVTTMVVTARFASDPALSHALAIGFVEGVARSVGQAHERV